VVTFYTLQGAKVGEIAGSGDVAGYGAISFEKLGISEGKYSVRLTAQGAEAVEIIDIVRQ